MADDLQSSEELVFVAEEVDRIALSAIETTLKDVAYEEQHVAQWVHAICETIMKALSELRKPLKFVVSCLIMQKNGAGLHSSLSAHWDTVTDGRWRCLLGLVWACMVLHGLNAISYRHRPSHSRTGSCVG